MEKKYHSNFLRQVHKHGKYKEINIIPSQPGLGLACIYPGQVQKLALQFSYL